MAIATLTDDEEQIASEFAAVRSIFDEIKSIYPEPHFCELSIGMSDDYPKAIEAGSTILNEDVILSIIQEEKPNQKEQIKISKERISKY